MSCAIVLCHDDDEEIGERGHEDPGRPVGRWASENRVLQHATELLICCNPTLQDPETGRIPKQEMTTMITRTVEIFDSETAMAAMSMDLTDDEQEAVCAAVWTANAAASLKAHDLCVQGCVDGSSDEASTVRALASKGFGSVVCAPKYGLVALRPSKLARAVCAMYEEVVRIRLDIRSDH